MFSKSNSVRSGCTANILASRKLFAFMLIASPVIYAILSLTINSVLDTVGVSSYQACNLGGGGRAKGQQVDVPLPHFFHPGAFWWQFLESLAALETGYSLDLQIILLMLGGCLSAAIGASLNTFLSSGFLKTIELKCFFRTGPSLGRNGSKLNGAISLSVCFS